MPDIRWPDLNRADDPELFDLYAESLLEPGWAGQLTDAQYEQIKDALKANRRLRTQWGFIHGNGRISFEPVQAVAMYGDPSDRSLNIVLIKQARACVLETVISAIREPFTRRAEYITTPQSTRIPAGVS